jgi:hypothetical protein
MRHRESKERQLAFLGHEILLKSVLATLPTVVLKNERLTSRGWYPGQVNIWTITQTLLWCMVVDYGLLLVWCLILKLPHQWIYNFSSKGLNLKLTEEQFDAYNFLGIAFFKMAIILFNLAPYIALRIVASQGSA